VEDEMVRRVYLGQILNWEKKKQFSLKEWSRLKSGSFKRERAVCMSSIQ
jgi:hypothetical protein